MQTLTLAAGRKDGTTVFMPLSLAWRVKLAQGIAAQGVARTHNLTVDSECRQQDDRPVLCRWSSVKHVEEMATRNIIDFSPSFKISVRPIPGISLAERNRYQPSNRVDTRALVALHNI